MKFIGSLSNSRVYQLIVHCAADVNHISDS